MPLPLLGEAAKCQVPQICRVWGWAVLQPVEGSKFKVYLKVFFARPHAVSFLSLEYGKMEFSDGRLGGSESCALSHQEKSLVTQAQIFGLTPETWRDR